MLALSCCNSSLGVIHILHHARGGVLLTFVTMYDKGLGGLRLECDETFLKCSIFSTFDLKIANLVLFWSKFGSIPKVNLEILC